MRIAVFAILASSLAAQPSGEEFFESRIRPIFAAKCFACHGGEKRTGGLNLSTPENIARGGDSGAIINRQAPEESRLLHAVGYQERVKMPPTGKLAAQQIADLTEWVKMGAPMPGAQAAIAPSAARKKEFTKGQKEFWSFQPVKSVEPPLVQNAVWAKSPIDRFILAKLEAKGLAPAKAASKTALLRRATFDLTGLSPAPEDVRAFLADESPDAFEKVVDRLLASPRYGERWGRHWLDVARYADSTGADEDHRYPHAWRYRDYVIEAFNKDLPYNRFVREQIAGDLLPGPDGGPNRNGIIATGFLSIGPRLIAEQDKVKMLYDFIDEQIDTTSRAFLGLTVACARCHDHKFDPIPTRDYYSMASIFANTKSFRKIEGTVSQMYIAPLVPRQQFDAWDAVNKKASARKREADILAEKETLAIRRGQIEKIASYMAATYRISKRGQPRDAVLQELHLDADQFESWKTYMAAGSAERIYLERWFAATDANYLEIAAAFQAEAAESYKQHVRQLSGWEKRVAKALAAGNDAPEAPKMNEAQHPFYAGLIGKKEPLHIEEKALSSDAQARIAALRTEAGDLSKSAPPEPDMACAVTEGEPVKQKVFIRGDAGNPGEEVDKRFLSIIAGENQTPIASGSGRKELAEWLTDGKHPLTARVMVNRIWQGHFGEGLVRTPSNYGLLGEKPSHPELLDYLAARFVESGWSIKAMHRLMMLSSTYLMSSEITKEKAEKDAANRLLSRFPRRRLDVEEIRDAMLQIEGSLDLAMGGTLQKGTGTDGENAADRKSINPENLKRRTVYVPLRRSNLPTLLNLFDFGDATTSSEGRARTNVAPQALFMMNSAFVAGRSAGLAKALQGSSAERVEQAYLKVLARRPDAEETAAALAYVDDFASKRAGSGSIEAWESLGRILLGSNEFVYVD